MKETRGARIAKGCAAAVFLLMLFLPGIVLPLLSRSTGAPLDVPLSGFTPPQEKVALSPESWLSGDFQDSFTERVEANVKPRSIMVRLYNTVNMRLFHKGQQIIGKGYDIFEPEYIRGELTLTEADDFSLPENVRAMQVFVDQLVQVQELLRERGKTLVVYIAPSKADLNRENIPGRYLGVSPGHRRAVDVFREEIGKTDVPFLICADLADELEYPAFYPTGIHWSRTYEQIASRRIIGMIGEASGVPYTNIALDGAQESETPFWRDGDVMHLANVLWHPDNALTREFWHPGIRYYQYTSRAEAEEDVIPMTLLLQGDSFGLGLKKDLLENIPGSEVYFVTNDYSLTDPDETVTLLEGSWENLDWGRCLDAADVVAIEMTEPLLKNRTFGFVPALLEKLQADGQ